VVDPVRSPGDSIVSSSILIIEVHAMRTQVAAMTNGALYQKDMCSPLYLLISITAVPLRTKNKA